MSELASYQLKDGVATIAMTNGKVNALSPDLIAALNQALDQAERDQAVVVLTGQPGVFSGGFDLKVMMTSMSNAIALVTAGSQLARRMLAHPYPIVSACSGHAVAMGAFLLLSSDYRIGVDGPFTVGLNEVAIGMTMHHVGIELARDRLSKAAFQRCVLCAEMMQPHAAREAGFLDSVVAPDQLMANAMAMAQGLSKLNLGAHGRTKLKARKALLETLDRAIELDKTSGLAQ